MRAPLKKYLGLLKEAASSWSADYAPSMGAAISYYTVFSLPPQRRQVYAACVNLAACGGEGGHRSEATVVGWGETLSMS